MSAKLQRTIQAAFDSSELKRNTSIIEASKSANVLSSLPPPIAQWLLPPVPPPSESKPCRFVRSWAMYGKTRKEWQSDEAVAECDDNAGGSRVSKDDTSARTISEENNANATLRSVHEGLTHEEDCKFVASGVGVGGVGPEDVSEEQGRFEWLRYRDQNLRKEVYIQDRQQYIRSQVPRWRARGRLLFVAHL
jgi:hypothetical protein